MNVCVFCGSSMGNDLIYSDAARELGILLAKKNHCLIYGGGNIGLMGVIADTVLQHGGEVVGVIPDFLVQREVAHHGVTRLEIVYSMHERKKRMAELSDSFLAMPGGWGTLDELAEILTWKQLALIPQPVGLLNVNHFFDPLLSQMRYMVSTGFLREQNLSSLVVENSAEKLLAALLY